MREPLLLLDIDGVLSIFGFDTNRPPAGRWQLVDGIVHFLSTDAAEMVGRLADVYEIVWCSGWEDRADEHLPGLLGVPRGLPHLSFDGRTRADVSARAHWKLDAVDEHAGERPLAWVDDAFNDACHAWARERDARGAPTLLVATDPSTGLDDDAAAALQAFARTTRSRPRRLAS
jgi:hypothetical protein